MKKKVSILLMLAIVFLISISAKAEFVKHNKNLTSTNINFYDTTPPPYDTIPDYNIPVTGIYVNPENLWLSVDESSYITVNVLPLNATNQNVFTNNLNPDIISIDPITKYVTALALGNARVEFISEEGNHIGYTNIFVIQTTWDSIPDYNIPVTGIYVNPENLWLAVDETSYITVNVLPLNATNQNVFTNNLNPDIISIDPITKYVTALALGNARVEFISEEGNHIGYTNIFVVQTTWDSIPDYNIPVTSIYVNSENLWLAVDESSYITVNVLPLNATNQNVFTNNLNPDIISIDPITKYVTALALGNARVEFISEEGNHIGYTNIFVIQNTWDSIPQTDSIVDGTPLEILNEQENAEYQIYPNPTKGQLTIKSIKRSSEFAEIYNFEGKLINRYLISEIENNINIEDLKNGIYILRIGKNITKIIKQ